MKIQYSVICDIGLRAKENQDRTVCLSDGQCGLFAVADGMGGLSNGSFASQTIKEELEAWWQHYAEETCPTEESRSEAESLKEVLNRANTRIREGTPEGERCGSTVVVLFLRETKYILISCGDSRCYQMKKKFFTYQLTRLTRDDIWENVPANVKGLSEEEIRKHRNHGRLIRAVGTGSSFTCTVSEGTLPSKSVFLLCSDGMHKRVSEEDVKQAARNALSGEKEKLESGCGELKKKVYRKGAGDNISIIMAYVGTD